jgi:two-component system phosphate regulon sensor histidine kinase PhoR
MDNKIAGWFSAKFARRLALYFCALIFAAVLAAGLLLERAAKNAMLGELSGGLRGQAAILAAQIPVTGWSSSDGGMEKEAARFSAICNCRVTFIDPQGTVLGDSGVSAGDLPQVENHSGRPEVRAALSGRQDYDIRLSHTLNSNFLYVALPAYDGAKLLGIVRLAVPLDRVDAKIAHLRFITFTILGIMLLLAVACALRLAASLAMPLNGIAMVAKKLAGGDYAARVRFSSSDEHGELAEALNMLAERVQETLNALEQDRARLAAILSSMGEALVALDASGKIQFANRDFWKIFNLSGGNKGLSLAEATRNAKLEELFEAVMRSGSSAVAETVIFSGGETIFEVRAAPLVSVGRINGAILVLHDVTRVRSLENMRRDFVASVSHELRTPIASIKASAETLLDGALEDAANNRDFVEAIGQDASRLESLVDDILDLSAVEAGRRQPKFEKLELEPAVRQIVARLANFAAGLEVELSAPELSSLPAVRADRVQFEQILTNLINNAVKFNRPGGRVMLSALREGDAVRVTVRDTGIGIPQKDLPRIFERFYRVDKARSRRMGGTGLGLSIVKHLVEAHGGAVRVESVEGEGSAFSFTLGVAE